MSTPSKIILKVRREDIGRKIKFNKAKLPIPLKEWVEKDIHGKIWLNEQGKDLCEGITIKGDYIGIYCRWDGYLDGVGSTLKECFNDYETALNLIAGGFCSVITSDYIRHYADRSNQKWDDIKPIQGSLEEVCKNIYGNFTYLFEDNVWKTGEDKEEFHDF